jgi:hypothetical protein
MHRKHARGEAISIRDKSYPEWFLSFTVTVLVTRVMSARNLAPKIRLTYLH